MKKTLTFLILLLFSACTVTQEFHFNNDFSGTYHLVIDQKEMNEAINNIDSYPDTTKTHSDQFSKAVEDLDTLGIKNIQYVWNDSTKTHSFSFDFDNPEVLNGVFNDSKMEMSSDTVNYQYLKVINENTIRFHNYDKSNETNSPFGDLKYIFVFSFDREIIEIDNEKYKLSDDRKKAILETSTKEIQQTESIFNIRFKLK